jgi:hypothetical protein
VRDGLRSRDAIDARGKCGLLRLIHIFGAKFRLLSGEARGRAQQPKREYSANTMEKIDRHAISLVHKELIYTEISVYTKISVLRSAHQPETDYMT